MAADILSQREKEKFVSDGFIYVFDRQSADNITHFGDAKGGDYVRPEFM